jgi:hypothetical protein
VPEVDSGFEEILETDVHDCLQIQVEPPRSSTKQEEHLGATHPLLEPGE